MLQKSAPVSLIGADDYDREKLLSLLESAFAGAGVRKSFFENKNVVIKVNLVRRCDESRAATTHPAFVFAASKLANRYGAKSVVVAESPGGPHTPAAMQASFDACGITQAAKDGGAILSLPADAENVPAPNGKVSGTFHVLRAFADADVIVNLARLKTHGLTLMTGAVKNYFGLIPGVEKFEMHARFSEKTDFCGMLVDLCECISERAETVNVLDAIIGMEGNGPTNGQPRKMGFFCVSRSAFNADLVAENLLGLKGRILTSEIAKERGLASDNFEIVGDDPEKLAVPDLKLPDSHSVVGLLGSAKLLSTFRPYPKIDKNACRVCGRCAASCPKHTIEIKTQKGKKEKRRVVIHKKDCIRCFCCQELCPFDAVRIRQNPIISLIT